MTKSKHIKSLNRERFFFSFRFSVLFVCLFVFAKRNKRERKSVVPLWCVRASRWRPPQASTPYNRQLARHSQTKLTLASDRSIYYCARDKPIILPLSSFLRSAWHRYSARRRSGADSVTTDDTDTSNGRLIWLSV